MQIHRHNAGFHTSNPQRFVNQVNHCDLRLHMPKRTQSSASPWIPSGDVRRNTTSVPRFESHIFVIMLSPPKGKKAMVIILIWVKSPNTNDTRSFYLSHQKGSIHVMNRRSIILHILQVPPDHALYRLFI